MQIKYLITNVRYNYDYYAIFRIYENFIILCSTSLDSSAIISKAQSFNDNINLFFKFNLSRLLNFSPKYQNRIYILINNDLFAAKNYDPFFRFVSVVEVSSYLLKLNNYYAADDGRGKASCSFNQCHLHPCMRLVLVSTDIITFF